MKWVCRFLLAVCALVMLCACAIAEEDPGRYWITDPAPEISVSGLVATLPAQNGHAEISALCVGGEMRLFLPAFADPDTMTLTQDGQSVAWTDVQKTEEGWIGDVQNAAGETLFSLHVMRSENLRALFLFSDDPVNQGRAYIDGGERHSTETTGSMAIVSPEGRVDHAGKLRQLRGRGNYTWIEAKKPYQFKLEERADLLMTGDAQEASRTWVLLADITDGTLLRNRIAMDLGLEMGMERTSHSEHVDLYYDGEYRGLYLLCEKVEIDPARIDETDYDKLIETWNERAGQYDLEALEVKEGQNRFGNAFTYIDGVHAAQDPAAGAYLLELEAPNTLSDRCVLHTSDGATFASKNPENATQAMMTYISERLEEARRTLKNGGVNPENGRTLHDDFNVEAFARLVLLNEMLYNMDFGNYSSTWFVLPAGQTRFEPGVAWDFDLGMRYERNGRNDLGMGVKERLGWLEDFYGCDAFVETMQRLFAEELSPIVQKILLGQEHGRYLKPLDAYVEEIDASRRMNDQLWDYVKYGMYEYANDFEGEVALLRAFLAERFAWLSEAVPAASPYTADVITLWGSANYMHVDGTTQVFVCPWNNVDIVSSSAEQLTEATEEDYALWQLEVFIAPKAGYAFENPQVTFAGTPVSHEMQQDGSLRILVTFEDVSYRPVDYYGDDVGMVYNEESYRQNYPEISAKYEDDSEGLLEYFCDEGMYEGHKGNAFFEPAEILHHNAGLLDVLGTDWQMYYWEYPIYGVGDGWLLGGGGWGFTLQVTDALE